MFESARALNWRDAEKVAADERPGMWTAQAKVKLVKVLHQA